MADEKHVRSLPDLHNVKSLNIRASLHVNEMETKHNTVDLYNKDACVQGLKILFFLTFFQSTCLVSG